jgi:hypothetical protein
LLYYGARLTNTNYQKQKGFYKMSDQFPVGEAHPEHGLTGVIAQQEKMHQGFEHADLTTKVERDLGRVGVDPQDFQPTWGEAAPRDPQDPRSIDPMDPQEAKEL